MPVCSFVFVLLAQLWTVARCLDGPPKPTVKPKNTTAKTTKAKPTQPPQWRCSQRDASYCGPIFQTMTEVKTSAGCRELCRVSFRCKLWTWVGPHYQVNTSRIRQCFLREETSRCKNRLWTGAKHKGLVSGYVPACRPGFSRKVKKAKNAKKKEEEKLKADKRKARLKLKKMKAAERAAKIRARKALKRIKAKVLKKLIALKRHHLKLIAAKKLQASRLAIKRKQEKMQKAMQEEQKKEDDKLRKAVANDKVKVKTKEQKVRSELQSLMALMRKAKAVPSPYATFQDKSKLILAMWKQRKAQLHRIFRAKYQSKKNR
eukprot:TRINITY_DN69620_c0_g1_i1.p1 TRINITY_DN69620_c0_g1~~TRINITY_DN69620_c0_g1_i1.p1  ORF type:complete len:317 (-),score=59.03 TRINITY_DN69620_c0_g1_i1:47-997(-)